MIRHSSENKRTSESKPSSGNKPVGGSKPSKFNAQAQASSAVDKLFGARQGEQLISGLKLIQHGHIEVKPQPRTTFSDTEVAELASNISNLHERGEGVEGTGILQPLIVALQDDSSGVRYRLIAGERRFRASQKAGLTQVPCLVLTVSESGVLPIQLIENLQRQNLAPLDEGRALQQLKGEQNLSVRDIAKSIGKTRGYVTNRLDLLKMEADVQRMVSSREDTLKHAALINAVQDAQLRSELIQAVIEEGASVKTIESRITGIRNDSFQNHPNPDQTGNTTKGRKPAVSDQENLDDLELPAGNASRNLSEVRETTIHLGSRQLGSPEGSSDGMAEPTAILNSGATEGFGNTHATQDSESGDLIAHSLHPAAALMAQAAHHFQNLQLQNLQLEPEYKQQLRDLVGNMREQLDQIEQAIE